MAEKLKQQSKGQPKARAAKSQKAGAQQAKSQPMKKSGHSCSCC